MIKRTFIAATVAILTGTNSFAADLDDNSVDDTFGWGGFYGGIHFGFARGDARTTGISGEPFDQPTGLGHIVETDPNGVMYGGQIGFNWQFDNGFIMGVEIEGGDLGANGEHVGTGPGPNDLDDVGLLVDYGAYGVFAGRLGYAMDRWMVNVKGGYAIAEVDVRAGDLDAPFIGPTFDLDHSFIAGRTEDGYAVGAGIEYAIDSNWILKADYLYMDFGSFRSTDVDSTYRTDLDLHTFKVGLNYKF